MTDTETNTRRDTLPYGIAPSAYRLPAQTRIGKVRLQVSNIEESIRFYHQVLGFHLHSRSEGRATLGAWCPSSEDPSPEERAMPSTDELIELYERPGARKVPRQGLLGLYHFAILLPNRASLGRFLQHLTTLGIHAGMADHWVSEAVYLNDPDGLGIEVYADRPREKWTHADRELSMTTLPLDVRDVIEAGHGRTWTGLPQGTVIGHVHLHVGDLAVAESFYHQGLGFDKTVWSYPSALFLAAGGYHHHVGTNTWAGTVPSAGENDARLLDWEIVVPDTASLDAVNDNLVRMNYQTKRIGNEIITQDPWGTGVRIVAA